MCNCLSDHWLQETSDGLLRLFFMQICCMHSMVSGPLYLSPGNQLVAWIQHTVSCFCLIKQDQGWKTCIFSEGGEGAAWCQHSRQITGLSTPVIVCCTSYRFTSKMQILLLKWRHFWEILGHLNYFDMIKARVGLELVSSLGKSKEVCWDTHTHTYTHALFFDKTSTPCIFSECVCVYTTSMCIWTFFGVCLYL